MALAAAIEKLVAVQPGHREQLVGDIEGDAIDAVLAGLAALRAHQRGFAAPPRPVLDEVDLLTGLRIVLGARRIPRKKAP